MGKFRTYAYRCEECGVDGDMLFDLNTEEVLEESDCPECGGEGTYKKVPALNVLTPKTSASLLDGNNRFKEHKEYRKLAKQAKQAKRMKDSSKLEDINREAKDRKWKI